MPPTRGAQARLERDFSLDAELIRDILRHARPLAHRGDVARLNLGFGFLYYALVRVLRPRHVVVTTPLRGETLPCYVVQIAAKTVDGIDSYVARGTVSIGEASSA